VAGLEPRAGENPAELSIAGDTLLQNSQNAQGGGNRCAWSSTNSVSSGERGAVVVAIGVDKNAAAAIPFVKGERLDELDLADFWQTAT